MPNFLAPTPSRGIRPPHRKISRPKSLSLCSFFFPEQHKFCATRDVTGFYALFSKSDCFNTPGRTFRDDPFRTLFGLFCVVSGPNGSLSLYGNVYACTLLWRDLRGQVFGGGGGWGCFCGRVGLPFMKTQTQGVAVTSQPRRFFTENCAGGSLGEVS